MKDIKKDGRGGNEGDTLRSGEWRILKPRSRREDWIKREKNMAEKKRHETHACI